MLIEKLVSRFLLITFIASLAACGGGGGGSSPPANNINISGTATAPGGTVAMFRNHNVLYAFGQFFISGASAIVTGLQPVTGATVELIEVDANGVQVGDVLATSATSITGSYQLTLPQGVSLSAKLIVRITGTGGINLRAQVVEQSIDISPVTEFILQKLIGAGTDLTTLATNEVITLTGNAEQFDLTAAANLTQMLADLETEVGSFVDNEITTINNGQGDAAALAGDYHLGFLDLGLHDSDLSLFGNFNSSIEIGSFTITDSGNGAFTAMSTDSVYAYGSQTFFPSNPVQLFLDTQIEVTPELFSGSVDGLGAIVVDIPFEEDLNTTIQFGWRFPPQTFRLEPAGSTGIYIGRDAEVGVRYGLVDTDGNGTLDAIDPNNRQGDEPLLGFALSARKSQGLTAASVTGNYGLVGMEVQSLANGTTNAAAFFSIESFDGSSNVTEASFDGSNITRTAGGASITTSNDMITANSTYTVAADGVFSITEGSQTDVGFVGDGGNLLTIFSNTNTDDGLVPPTVTAFSHAAAIGVKLPTTLPDMTGRSYQLFSLQLNYDGSATSIETLTKGQIVFNGDGTLNITGVSFRKITRTTDLANIMPVTGTSTDSNNQSVAIGTNGSLTFSLDTETFDGFVSADGQMILLRTKDNGGATNQSVGMIIGILN